MIFVGDIAIPFKEAFNIEDIPERLRLQNWFGNMEGALVNAVKENRTKRVVYNDFAAIEYLLEQLNFIGFALANNHFFDIDNLSETIRFLAHRQVGFVGAGENIEAAQKPLILEEEDQQIVILNFGWEVIQCKIADAKAGVNPLIKSDVIDSVDQALTKYPNSHIVPFMHWGYELEGAPQPFERELAKHLIDLGVSGVIGTHSHRVGGIEFHRGKPIVYSLGNWLFKQGYYHGGKINFPKFCNSQLAFEWNFGTNEHKLHFFTYQKTESKLLYTKTLVADKDSFMHMAPYTKMDKHEYAKWYQRNHYHKGKGLPIYLWDDSKLEVDVKNFINLIRDQMVALYSRIRT